MEQPDCGRTQPHLPTGRAVAVIEDDGTATLTTTRSAPWQLGDGTWVVLLEDRAGGYDLRRVHAIRGPRRDPLAELVTDGLRAHDLVRDSLARTLPHEELRQRDDVQAALAGLQASRATWERAPRAWVVDQLLQGLANRLNRGRIGRRGALREARQALVSGGLLAGEVADAR